MAMMGEVCVQGDKQRFAGSVGEREPVWAEEVVSEQPQRLRVSSLIRTKNPPTHPRRWQWREGQPHVRIGEVKEFGGGSAGRRKGVMLANAAEAVGEARSQEGRLRRQEEEEEEEEDEEEVSQHARRRSGPSHDQSVSDDDDDEDDEGPQRTPESSGAKYQLRPRSGQGRQEGLSSDGEWLSHVQGRTRPRPRPRPLSRYRRKTANARERCRMQQINSAFESLRGVLPSWVCSSRRSASHMTKIATLRLASAYINSLQDILDGKAHQDTRSWVLSSLLQEASTQYRPQPHANDGRGKTDQRGPDGTESELVSLGALSHEGVPEDNLESRLGMTALPEAEGATLLIGWSAHHRPAVVT